jgi:hypothetical protein
LPVVITDPPDIIQRIYIAGINCQGPAVQGHGGIIPV